MTLQNKHSTIVTHILISVFVLLCVIFYDKWYTLINFLYAIILLLLVKYKANHLLKHYYLTFLVMLIPFFIVNGILTGSAIEHQVVWYNNAENLGIRLGTIPVEDVVYAFTMLLTVLTLTDYFDKRFSTLKAT
jgi:lycopene cyclase domain-containing protein